MFSVFNDLGNDLLLATYEKEKKILIKKGEKGA